MKTFTALLVMTGAITFLVSVAEITRLNNRLDRIEARLGGKEQIDCNQQESVARVRESVVRVVGGETEGSGFAIRSGGHILTNHHVIATEPSPKVILPDGTFEEAAILIADPDSDLALLKIKRDLPVLPLKSVKWLKPADELLAVGFPLGGMIRGEASVTKGTFSGLRYFESDRAMTYVQTDAQMTSGVSGGPLVDICGEAVGVNAMGIYGLNMGISVDSIRRKLHELSESDEPIRDVQKIVLEPNRDAMEAVRAFYSFIKVRRLEKAFELLSDNFVKGYSFDHWARGYKSQLDTTIIDIAPDLDIPNRVRVKLGTKDLMGDAIITRLFEGYWDARQVNGHWLLWDPEIREVTDPDEEWFQTTQEKVEAIRAELELVQNSSVVLN